MVEYQLSNNTVELLWAKEPDIFLRSWWRSKQRVRILDLTLLLSLLDIKFCFSVSVSRCLLANTFIINTVSDNNLSKSCWAVPLLLSPGGQKIINVALKKCSEDLSTDWFIAWLLSLMLLWWKLMCVHLQSDCHPQTSCNKTLWILLDRDLTFTLFIPIVLVLWVFELASRSCQIRKCYPTTAAFLIKNTQSDLIKWVIC